MLRPSVGVCLAASLVVLQWPAHADGPKGVIVALDEGEALIEAKKRFSAGTRAMQQKQFAEAAYHFEAAHAAVPSGVALLGSAVAWDAAGQPQRAADAYARSTEEPGTTKAQKTTARARLEVLERSLGTLVVHGRDGMRAQLDDNVDSGTPARLHGQPGAHRLTVWSNGRIFGTRDVYLRIARHESIEGPWRLDAPTSTAPSGSVVRDPPYLRPPQCSWLGAHCWERAGRRFVQPYC